MERFFFYASRHYYYTERSEFRLVKMAGITYYNILLLNIFFTLSPIIYLRSAMFYNHSVCAGHVRDRNIVS